MINIKCSRLRFFGWLIQGVPFLLTQTLRLSHYYGQQGPVSAEKKAGKLKSRDNCDNSPPKKQAYMAYKSRLNTIAYKHID